MKSLVINVCPRGHGYYSIAIEDENGGQRVIDRKCCGSWKTLRSFSMSASDWRELAELAQVAAKEAEDEAD